MADPESKEPRKPGTREPTGEHALAAQKMEFIQSFFKRAEEFTETLLRENERLRYQIVELEERLKRTGAIEPPGAASLRELVDRIDTLEKEKEQLVARFRSVENENIDYVERYREIERENNHLANLYVASYQLHSTLDLREITQIILEILLNFVGARTFAVLLLDEQKGLLRPLASEGIARDRVPVVKAGEGTIGRVVETGEPRVEGRPQSGNVDLERPLIVTPLRIGGRVVGAIVIWEFLKQKTELVEVDHELFNLLAAHAASALQSAKLALELGGRPAALWGAVDLV
jgi:hypothetical protein